MALTIRDVESSSPGITTKPLVLTPGKKIYVKFLVTGAQIAPFHFPFENDSLTEPTIEFFDPV